MAKFHLSNKAVEDLSNIWDYTYEVWSEEQADKYYKILLNSCQEISENPNIGINYNNISENLLGFLIKRHIIFYKNISENEITVIRILHGRMDLKNRLLNE